MPSWKTPEQIAFKLPGLHKCDGDFDLRAGDQHPLLGSDYGDGRRIVCVRTTACERNGTPWTWVCPEHTQGGGDPHPFDWAVLPAENPALVIDITLNMLAGLGHIDPDCLDDDQQRELVDELNRLYLEGGELLRARVEFREGDPWRNMAAQRPAEHLARVWEYEQHLRWQRELAPRFECPYCQTQLGYLDGTQAGRIEKGSFYTLDPDGEFVDQVKACPCGRDVLGMLKDQGQLRLLET
jgi:hypothetical protein